jgi:2-haloalkanoic acid dehalogenase type II
LKSFDIGQFEAVVFDLDSTLIDTQNYPIVATEWFLTKTGVSLEEKMMSYVRNLVTRYRHSIHAIVQGAPYRNPFSIIKTAMKNSLVDLEIDAKQALVDEAAQKFKLLHIELSKPNDGVEELLGSLDSRGLKLGIITNSFEGHAKIILANIGWSHFFSSVLDCSSVQNYKPSSLLFDRASKDLGLEPSEIIYVGDEYYSDMVGAKGAGMDTIWINKRNRSLSDLIEKHGVDSTPDYVLGSVSEMCDML